MALFQVVLALLSGLVVEDLDGDGQASSADRPLPDVVVALEGRAFTRTGADGRFQLDAAGAGAVWVRIPDGFEPRSTYRMVSGVDRTDLDFALTARPLEGPLRFVHASDSHLGVVTGDDLEAALQQATAGEPTPYFLVIDGDVTQDTAGDQFEAYLDVVRAARVPVVSVSGNHDVYDGGGTWALEMGPIAWSFDAGGVHFVVLSAGGSGEERAAFLAADAAQTPASQPTAAFLHYALSIPYDQVLYDALVAAEVRWFFSGHYHGNRTLSYGPLTEYNVEPIVFGGMDGLPAGYQVVTFDGADLAVEHHTITEGGGLLEVVHPRPTRAGACLPAGEFEVVVDAVFGPGPTAVEVIVDGAAPLPLARASAWAFSAVVDASPGEHTLLARVRRPGETMREESVAFCTGGAALPAMSDAVWSQLGGGPEHRGAVATPFSPPLTQVWAAPVGGQVKAPPVLEAGRLFVPVADFGTGQEGGLVALDAQTGARLWIEAGGAAVHGSPAVAGSIVVRASVDGQVRALDAATGEELWSYEVNGRANAGKRSLHGGVALADGRVYAGGVYSFVALDVETGTVLWEARPDDPDFPTHAHATPAVSQDLVVAPLRTADASVLAFESLDGARPWTSPAAWGMTAAPVVTADGRALVSGSDSLLSLLRLDDGTAAWERKLFDDGHLYAFWLRVTPALAGDRVFVPTHLGELAALAVDDGRTLWEAPVGIGRTHGVHYEAASRGINAAPVVTGDVVWFGGDDGVLRAVNAESGGEGWSVDLGAPLSGIVPGGEALFVSGWDGVVRSLVFDPGGPGIDWPDGPPADHRCGCHAGANRGNPPLGAIALLAIFIFTRRARSRPRC